MTVRFANRKGRACLLLDEGYVDVEHASGGRFASDPMHGLGRWDELTDWARSLKSSAAEGRLDDTELGPPVPRPAKVFAIGMNYKDHAQEAGLPIPGSPVVFTKFPNCLVGPRAAVELSSAYVDWEVELVVVLGKRGKRIPEERALDYIAGFCVGQDISDRRAQFADTPPQFSMGKSYDTYGPIGPAVVTADALADLNDLTITCSVGGEVMQNSRTSELIFPVAALISFLSRRCTLEPGDLIFTGTPAGVGSTRSPRRYLQSGEEIVSSIEGLGELRNRCVGTSE
jgi:2-keto-4-pentenoate hydratase/2-oxohepta-3-ene-1,7-dioic acid hydratase in catechol pathway